MIEFRKTKESPLPAWLGSMVAALALCGMLLSISCEGNDTDGDATDGDTENGALDGDTDGDATDGDIENDAPDGDADGDSPDGDTGDGDFDGDASDGDSDGDADEEGERAELDADQDGPESEEFESDGDTEDAPEDPESIEPYVMAVDQTAYAEDLNFIAQERVPGSPHWQAVQDLCAERFAEYGYETERLNYGTGVNVIGRKPGLDPQGVQILISAHYDHIADCPGADDNGSGVAALLETARVLADANFSNTLILACWDEEESGLVGSLDYAEDADARGDAIAAAFVYETMAYTDSRPNSQEMPIGFDLLFREAAAWLEARENRGDFLAVIADERARPASDGLAFWGEAVGLPLVVIELTDNQKNSDLFADLRRSDHAAFWLYDRPALMLTDTADFRNPYYHITIASAARTPWKPSTSPLPLKSPRPPSAQPSNCSACAKQGKGSFRRPRRARKAKFDPVSGAGKRVCACVFSLQRKI
ncbi:MAG: M20/M25/M40 family metallo-hydrolase [Myxococcales bacterium]|nr:MAG: M20/M25/M40 family metallo-hydrolase [Myxococcales bacterium]